jgi:hypothetical protein
MTTAVQQLDGLARGVQTRARAKAAGRPVSYQVAIEAGWLWAIRAGATSNAIHLVPPHGERAWCGTVVPLDGREQVVLGVVDGACGRCWQGVLGGTPRRAR